MQVARDFSAQIHLLLTDVVMPKSNGLQLSQLLLEAYPQLKILYMSGYTAEVIDQQGVLDEGVMFIGKPFSLQNLAQKVREAL